MGSQQSAWFEAVRDENVYVLQQGAPREQYCGDQASEYFGLCGLHVAALYGREKSVSLLVKSESSLPTRVPLSIWCEKRGNFVKMPAGISYEHILALQGKQEQLVSALKSGIVKSDVSLLACCIIGMTEEFVLSHIDELAEQQSCVLSPVKVACIFGFNRTVNELCNHSGVLFFEQCERAKSEIDSLLHCQEYYCLEDIKKDYLKIDACKDILMRKNSFSPEASLRPALSITDYVEE